MKRILISTLFLSALLLTGRPVHAQEIVGYSGSRDFDISGFTELEIRSNFKVELQQADEFQVTAYFNESEEVDASRIKVVKQGQTLIIRYEQDKDRIFWERNKEDVTILIKMPELSALSIYDKVDLKAEGEFTGTKINITAQDYAKASRLNLGGEFIDITTDNGAEICQSELNFIKGEYMVRGGSRVDVTSGILECYATVGGTGRLVLNSDEMDSFRVQLSSTGKLDIRGKGCSTLTIEGNGMSEYNGIDFPVEDADINISGKSRVKLLMEEGGSINAITKGMSTIRYKGTDVNIRSVDSKPNSIKNI